MRTKITPEDRRMIVSADDYNIEIGEDAVRAVARKDGQSYSGTGTSVSVAIRRLATCIGHGLHDGVDLSWRDTVQ
jgi:hypothetical protein